MPRHVHGELRALFARTRVLDQFTPHVRAFLHVEAGKKFIRHLPVVDGSGVIGMVSIGDLVKAVIQDQQSLIEQLEGYLAR